MDYRSFIKKSNLSEIKRVVCFLRNGNQILLAKRKEGHGLGYWVGPGGKVEKGETSDECCKRELKEEINISATSFLKVFELNAYFEVEQNWNMSIDFYICESWNGESEESEEVLPQWFEISNLPFESMWDDHKFWFVNALMFGKTGLANCLYGENRQVKYFEYFQ